ncbi:MAG: hypothetical protein GY801_23240 [bacterium]|nr:hypothetical protein [bacterium]
MLLRFWNYPHIRTDLGRTSLYDPFLIFFQDACMNGDKRQSRIRGVQIKEYRNNQGHRVTLRGIVIWNTQTGKRVACVAPLEVEEDPITVATAMLDR